MQSLHNIILCLEPRESVHLGSNLALFLILLQKPGWNWSWFLSSTGEFDDHDCWPIPWKNACLES